MKGRGYTVSGCVEAKMDLSINSGTGNNEGILKYSLITEIISILLLLLGV
jgi:hypothetical protein